MASGGFLDRFIRQEIQGASPKTVRQEEEMAAYMAEQKALADEEAAMIAAGMIPQQVGGGLGAGRPLSPMPPMQLPMNLDHETMKIYLKPKTPEKKNLRKRERFWIYSDEVCTSILTSNLDKASQKRIEIIIRQAKDLDGCDNVDNLIHDLQDEAYMIVISNKARSDLPDHIRERIVPTVGMYGDVASLQQKSIGERPKEGRAIFGVLGGHK